MIHRWPKKILVVDDESAICDLVVEFLSFKGYAVSSASKGYAGLRMFQQEDYDLVLLDIRMPEISGLDVLREIKRIRPTTAVIMLSAYGDAETIRTALTYGAAHYIEKPMALEGLLRTIQGLEKEREEV
ncbi:Two component, sigma54 specific, transcriptional regulator, Fis family (fragment) [uncultured Desulfatiglans sp.]|uniref:Two component, sigma54 specific, transcriptional regulator, Fis family n=1 Tax=Uncultured Desulfatiglans sp. TaxID=1748965 RepID=A0A653A356_UNCDX